jgi:hypothetical protein
MQTYYSLWLTLQDFLVSRAMADQVIPNVNDSNRVVTQSYFRGGGNRNELNQAITEIWGRVFKVIFAFLGAAAVILLIWAGIQYITAGGSPDKAKKARAQIISIVVGIIVLVSAYAIISAILGLADRAATVT